MRAATALFLCLAVTAPTAAAQDLTPQERAIPEMPRAPLKLAGWGEAMDFARNRAVELRIAADEIERASAQQETALSAVVPNLSSSGSAIHNQLTQNVATVGVGTAAPSQGALTVLPTPNVASGSVTATQALVDLGAWHSLRSARANAAAARADAADLRRKVARNAADAILGVLTAEQIAALDRVGLRAALDRLDVARQKVALGAGNGLDVARVQRDVDSARDTVATGDESLHRAREALGLALGIDGELGVESGTGGAYAWAREASAECHAVSSLDQRDDLRAASARYRTSDSRVTDAALRFLPTLGAQTALTTTSDPTVLPRTTWSVAATLTLPIWDGGARHADLRDARAQRDEANLRLVGLRRDVSVEVERARRAITAASDRQIIATHARAVAAIEDGLTRQAYAIGQGSSLELVTAAASLRAAEIDLALRDFDVLRARVDLAFSTSTCLH